MVAVTAACCALAWRHASLVIALLGLVGGFATPLLLSSGEDRPIGLFGYVLLLDVGLLFLRAAPRLAPARAAVSLLGTLFYQALWIGGRMGPSSVALGLGVLGDLRARLRAARAASRRRRIATQWRLDAGGGGALAVRLRALLRGRRAISARSLIRRGAAGAALRRGELARRACSSRPSSALGAASASLAWSPSGSWTRRLERALAWEVALWSCASRGSSTLFVERERESAGRDGPAPPAALAAAGSSCSSSSRAGERAVGLWPWLAGWPRSRALAGRHGGFPGRESLQLVRRGRRRPRLCRASRWRTTAAPGSRRRAASLAVAARRGARLPVGRRSLRRGAVAARAWREHAAAAPRVVLLLLARRAAPSGPPPLLFLGGTLRPRPARRARGDAARRGRLAARSHGATALVHTALDLRRCRPRRPARARARRSRSRRWRSSSSPPGRSSPRARLREERFAWAAAALAGPAWFLSLRRLYELRFGDATIGLLPARARRACRSLAAVRARDAWRGARSAPHGGARLVLAVALGFLTVAIPLQLEKEWITIGWALEGLAVTRALAAPRPPGAQVLRRWRSSPRRRSAWSPTRPCSATTRAPPGASSTGSLYTYLVPAAALLGAGARARSRARSRARAPGSGPLYTRGWPLGALAAGLAGAGRRLRVDQPRHRRLVRHRRRRCVVSFERLPARDLTTSIAWALYALLLLALGVARPQHRARAGSSLGLLMVTIAKVFLYDLGELRDLYRVASLLGLAVSLILVSLAYQRFVFRRRASEEERDAT